MEGERQREKEREKDRRGSLCTSNWYPRGGEIRFRLRHPRGATAACKARRRLRIKKTNGADVASHGAAGARGRDSGAGQLVPEPVCADAPKGDKCLAQRGYQGAAGPSGDLLIAAATNAGWKEAHVQSHGGGRRSALRDADETAFRCASSAAHTLRATSRGSGNAPEGALCRPAAGQDALSASSSVTAEAAVGCAATRGGSQPGISDGSSATDRIRSATTGTSSASASGTAVAGAAVAGAAVARPTAARPTSARATSARATSARAASAGAAA